MNLFHFLEKEYQKRNSQEELSKEKPDPLLVAKRYDDEKIALICALFAYGNSKQIVTFLESLDFQYWETKDRVFKNYYRFQTSKDVEEFFKTLQRAENLYDHFYEGYKREYNILEGLRELITYLRSLNDYSSYGYDFLIGRPPPLVKTKGVSAYKRWMMYLRWMVRKDHLDMGLWDGVAKSDLIIPLDTHTFTIGKKLNLIKRNRPDLAAAIELTESLKEFDPQDPLKYDFVLYRIGQENLSLD